MQRSDDRILTTHVGSLVRPPSLHRERGAPPPGPAALRAAVEDVVRSQVAVGLDVVTTASSANRAGRTISSSASAAST
jgi:5-methyltetrahydropteroyltriglutamate--homocysteine methyltransferase